MRADTAETGASGYDTSDGTLWYLHAISRDVATTGDLDLPASVMPALDDIIARHVSGTRYGIGLDTADGLLRQGQEGLALTWTDTRIDSAAGTARIGRAVDINALWIKGLRTVAGLKAMLGQSSTDIESFGKLAQHSNVMPDVTKNIGTREPNAIASSFTFRSGCVVSALPSSA